MPANGSDPRRATPLPAGMQDKALYHRPFDFGDRYARTRTQRFTPSGTANTYTIDLLDNVYRQLRLGRGTITYGEPYGDLPVLTDSSAPSFMGWFTQTAPGGTQVTADTVFTGTGNQTLYAHWEQKIEIQDSWITITPRSEEYDESEPGFPAEFTVNAPDGDLSAEDFTVTYLWEKAGSEWTEDAPVNAGGYLVKLSRATDDKYLAFELTTDQAAVAINKLNLTLKRPVPTISNWIATVDVSGLCESKGTERSHIL